MIPLYDDVPSERFPVVNYLLIAANLGVFALELAAGPHLGSLVRTWALTPRLTLHAFEEIPVHGFTPRLLTPLTSMFMHAGWLHVLGNMWFLYLFGDNVEGRLGHGRYLVFYLLAGLVAAGAHVATDPRSMTPELGASGAIAGALGAYMVLFPYARVLTLVFLGIFITTLRISAPWFLGLWFAFQALAGFASFHVHQAGGVAWFAHLGGFAWGALVGLFFRRPPPRRRYARGYSTRR